MGARMFWVRAVLLSGVAIAVLALTAGCLGSGQSMGQGLDEAEGEASYYADAFAGQTTANGERFDPDEMTAAHPRLPFDTTVRVTRLDGDENRSVIVRINDRGPFQDDRIIDLSEAAARELGMIQEGVAEVRVEVVERPEDTSDSSGGVGKQW